MTPHLGPINVGIITYEDGCNYSLGLHVRDRDMREGDSLSREGVGPWPQFAAGTERSRFSGGMKVARPAPSRVRGFMGHGWPPKNANSEWVAGKNSRNPRLPVRMGSRLPMD